MRDTPHHDATPRTPVAGAAEEPDPPRHLGAWSPRPTADGHAPCLTRLPRDTKALLTLAAAAHHEAPQAPGASVSVLLRAAEAAQLPDDALESAERAGLLHADAEYVRLGPPLTFRAVYDAAPLRVRQAAHRVLASVLDTDDSDNELDPSARLACLSHLALGTSGPAADVAADLAAVARTAAHALTDDRRALALRRAAALAPDARARATLLVEAAEYAHRGGRGDWARRWAADVAALPADTATRGRAARLHGLTALDDGPVADARQSLLLAARLLDQGPSAVRVRCHLDAADAAWVLGDAAGFRQALAPLTREPAPGPGDTVAYGSGMRALLAPRRPHHAAASAVLRDVVERAEHADDVERLLRAGTAALLVGDLAAAARLSGRALAVARVAGPVTAVPRILEHLAYAELRAGRHLQARTHAEEGARAARRTGRRNLVAHHHAILALVASLDDDAAAVRTHADAVESTAAAHGLRQPATLVAWALARADLARGRPGEAAARLVPLLGEDSEHGHFALRMLPVPCFVEASVLAGTPEPARAPLAAFAVWADLRTDPQAPAQLARCQALLAAADGRDPDEVNRAYEAALARHPLPENAFEHGRTLLAYGRWLRRARRPAAARGVLRDARVTFDRCGARVWSAHAAAEMRATGAPPVFQPRSDLGELTPQQLRIARFVADGATNREIAAHLSVSVRTVDHHLRNAFATLGVRSRVELARLVDRAEAVSTAHRGEHPPM